MIERLPARPEWRFFGVLPQADRTRAVSWWAVLVLHGVLPALFAIAMGTQRRITMREVAEVLLASAESLAGAVLDPIDYPAVIL